MSVHMPLGAAAEVIIFRFDSTDEAIEALQQNGFKVLKGEQVYGL